MTTANTVVFSTLPLHLPETFGYQHLQVAAFFRKRLYVGLISQQGDLSPAPAIARILRYYPGADRWEIVCETPVATPDSSTTPPAKRLPLELGWRAMTVVADPNGQTYLALSLLCAHNPRLFHSSDGERFEALSDGVNPKPFGQLHAFQGWLFGAPAGVLSDGIAEKKEGGALLYATRDPRAEPWSPANTPGFGDPHNQVIHSLQSFQDWLYAAIGNPFAGFQLWRTQALGAPPFHWEQVLEQGGQRHTLNLAVGTMTVFQNALYLGTGVPATERLLDTAAGCEIVRVLPNGRWELVMGQPRFSPIGLQVPISTHGPGFDDPETTVTAALASTDDILYAATLRRNPARITGCQLWQTTDGENWQPLAIPNDAFSCAPRVLLALPKFLLVAGNYQSPEVTSQREPFLWFGKSAL